MPDIVPKARSRHVPLNPWRPEAETVDMPQAKPWKGIAVDPLGAAALPLRYTWRKHPARPPVSEQPEGSNTCIAHAACRMLETYIAVGGNTVHLDADLFHQCVFGLNCDFPIPKVSTGLQVMRDRGVPARSGFTAGSPCPAAAPVAHLPSYSRLRDTDDIKRALAEVGPVVAVIDIGPIFRGLDGDTLYRGESGGGTDSHAVLLIGFDDQADGGRWEAQNSFGTDWNGSGFVRIAYGTAAMLVDDRHTAFSIA